MKDTMRLHIRTLILLPVLLLLLQCSDPVDPGTEPPPPVAIDTTTHNYSWEIHYFGATQFSSSLFRELSIQSDESIWMVGELSGLSGPSIPSGYKSTYVRAVHWTGDSGLAYAIEGTKLSGNIRPTNQYGVFEKNGSLYFMGGLGCTEIREDTVVFHDLRNLNGLWYGGERVLLTKTGKSYLYGNPGFLAELKQDTPLGPMSIEQIDLPTEVQVAALAEAGVDDLYIGAWGIESLEYHFWRRKNGQLIGYDLPELREHSGELVTGLWASGDRLFALCPPFLFHECVGDTADRKFVNIDEFMDMSKTHGLAITLSGRANNDVFFAGHLGTVYHYNGKSVKIYYELQDKLSGVVFYDLEVTQDKVYIVGGGIVTEGERAVLLVGTRQ